MFEGFVGIRLWDGQWVNDVIFGVVFTLFVCFAIVFQANYRLFLKMLNDIIHLKERQNTFAVSGGNEWVFRNFMTVQALLLCGISLFAIMRMKGYLDLLSESLKLWVLAAVVGLLFLFYWAKRCCYWILGLVFANPEQYRLWRTGYNASIGSWGMFLYLPTLWLLFVESYLYIPVNLFVFLYILGRFVIINKLIRIFHRRNSSFLYLSLYLCGQEILPLFFMYKVVVYLYNYFGSSTLWH